MARLSSRPTDEEASYDAAPVAPTRRRATAVRSLESTAARDAEPLRRESARTRERTAEPQERRRARRNEPQDASSTRHSGSRRTSLRHEQPPLQDLMAETPSTPSAHMGESSVVSVSRRSERRRTGFTLVEEPAHRTYEPSTWGYAPAEHQRSVAYVQDQDRWPSREPRNWAASNTSAARDDRFGWGPAEPTDADRAPATPPHAYAESAQARRGKTRRRARQAMRFEPGSSCETEAPGYEVRSPFFTEEDYRAQRQTPGAKRRRAAVAEALATIPRAVASGVASAFGRLYLLVVAVIVVALVTSIYGPARSLYVANRRLETLQATYDALQAENDSIRNELELLQTREGIENEARARGYVQAGETKVLVENLPDELTSKGGAAEAVAEVEVTQDQPWYIQLLDVVFAYEPQT